MFDLEKMTMKKKKRTLFVTFSIDGGKPGKIVLVRLLVAAKEANRACSIICPEIVEEIPD